MSQFKDQPPIPQGYQDQQPILQQNPTTNKGQTVTYAQQPTQTVSNTYYTQNPQQTDGQYRLVQQQSPTKYQTTITQQQPSQYQPVQAQTYYNPQKSVQSPGRDYQFSPKRYPANPGKPSYSGKIVYPAKIGVDSFSIWDWCKYLIPLLFAIFALITCIFLLCSHTDMTPNEHAAKQVLFKAKKNLNAVPFTDFEVKDASIVCDGGYQEIVLGEWPGTENGCICQEDDGSHSVHHIAYCTLHPIKCEHVFGNDSVPIKTFQKKNNEGVQKTYHICADRADKPLQISEKCTGVYDEKAGPELCSVDEVLSKAEYVKDQAEFDKLNGVAKLDLEEKGGWKFVKDDNVLPLVNFNLVSSKKGDVVDCWRNDQQGATDSGKWYKLSSKVQAGCIQNPGAKEYDREDLTEEQKQIDQKINGKFQEQDGANKEDSDLNANTNNFVNLGQSLPLLKTYQNVIPSDDLDDLEYFDKSYDQNDQLHLILERRLYVNGANEKCKNIDTEHLTWIEEDSNTLKKVTTSWAIIIIVIAVAIILIFLLFFAIQKLQSSFAYRFMWLLFAIGVILAIIFGVIFFLYKPNGLDNLHNRYREYAIDDCFDDNSKPVGLAAETVSGYAKATLDNQKTESLWLFWGSIAFAVIGLLFIIFLIATGKGF